MLADTYGVYRQETKHKTVRTGKRAEPLGGWNWAGILGLHSFSSTRKFQVSVEHVIVWVENTFNSISLPAGVAMWLISVWRMWVELIFATFGIMPVKEMGEALAMNGGEGCTTVWMNLMPLNCTLKNNQNDKFYVMCIFPQYGWMNEQTNKSEGPLLPFPPPLATVQTWQQELGQLSQSVRRSWVSRMATGPHGVTHIPDLRSLDSLLGQSHLSSPQLPPGCFVRE